MKVTYGGYVVRRTGVLVIPGGGAIVARGKRCFPFEKISCLVPLRTGMS
jgi:hypothetical protein